MLARKKFVASSEQISAINKLFFLYYGTTVQRVDLLGQ